MELFVSPVYRDLLLRHGLSTFAGFWNLPHNWVEDPNERREGWSGASFYTIDDDRTGPFPLFVKRQENHNYRSLLRPFRGRPTFYREFINIRKVTKLGIPTATPVFYGHHFKDNKWQAVLATIALEGYRELNPLFGDTSVPASVRQGVLHRIADIIHTMHHHYLQHRSLSGKHVMVKVEMDGTFDVRIIDFEQMRGIVRPINTSARDLEKFIRHTPTLTPSEHAEFVNRYTQHLNPLLRRRFAAVINRRIVEKWPDSKLSVPT